ncbi:citrate/2-methylcitrate synthase [Salipiger abyssi]|uniref:citrate/2-methylcitrate synthase n=1 Tax=Salipiger abyssi TaxID=1250539 RepID=UPI001A8F9440|nr:citrate/2-methylcitrate synthase [Salipiger abyssi]MBN9887735.1 citrate synthase family protein [Salipiger abyssi]
MINIINMNSSDWIDASSACALLGVKPQTLYAYVSRGLVRTQADLDDARRCLYARLDVDALLQQNRRPRARREVAERAIRWGDPVLTTAISEVRDGMLWLRGRSVADCADTLTLEEMAAHLWAVDTVDTPPCDAPVSLPDPLGRALQTLTEHAPGARPLHERANSEITREAGALMSGVANALLGISATGPIHGRLARSWGADHAGYDDLRRALVLLSDHELNPSTFSVRIAASAGASLPAALLCGMATLSGARHGGVASRARAALLAARDGQTQAFLTAQSGHSPYGYGFGHPLYPGGDPRARLILERLAPDSAAMTAVRTLSHALDLPPNVDAALAALSMARGFPESAAFVIFATGRLAGWCAHAMEQAGSGEIIRPRARYLG